MEKFLAHLDVDGGARADGTLHLQSERVGHLRGGLTCKSRPGKLVVLHQVFNSLEKRFKNIKNRARRFWCMLKEYENSQGADKSLFETARKG